MPAHGFTLPIYVDLGATFLFALTGALVALRRGYDIVGLLALALVVGVGGGLLRDGLFIQSGPPVVTTDARYMLAVLAACGLAILLGDRGSRFGGIIDFADALGLGAYAVVGTQKSLDAGLSVLAAMLVGVINACGGSVARDILTREEPLLFKPGQFYALAAALGTALYALLVTRTGMAPIAAAWMAIAITFIFRALAIHFDWKTTAVRDLIRRVRGQPHRPPAPRG